MLDIAKGLSWQPLPRGRKVSILTGSGGIGAELADLCLEHGLEVPEFSPQLQAALRPYLPTYASVQNPVDLTPIWQEFPKLYGPLLRTFFASDEVDILLVTIIDVATTVKPLMHAVTEVVAQARIEATPAKPVYVYWASPHNMREHRQILQTARIPCYQSTLSTVRVAAAICHYAMQSVTTRG
jgi:acyl-CoA synthetase (NDP forming)